MKQLEKLAKESFDRFCKLKGIKGNWFYISEERKLEWYKEVLVTSNYLIGEIKSKIKPISNLNKNSSGYEVGFVQGSQNERVKFIEMLDKLGEELKEQFEEMKRK